jgi:hypothetical protein
MNCRFRIDALLEFEPSVPVYVDAWTPINVIGGGSSSG